MPRRTKIVATLGPATDTPAALADLVAAGVDLVRVNFSHGDFDAHARRIEAVRGAAAKAGRVVGILGDLRGPKVRIERFATGKAMLVEGERFTLDASFDPGNDTRTFRRAAGVRGTRAGRSASARRARCRPR